MYNIYTLKNISNQKLLTYRDHKNDFIWQHILQKYAKRNPVYL